MSRDRLGADGDRETFMLYTESLIWAKLRIGLVSEAMQEFRGQADEIRKHLQSAPPNVVDETGSQRFIQENANLLLDVAYAMYSLGDSEFATELLADRDTLLYGKDVEELSDAASASALREAMSRELSDDSLFDMYIFGRLDSDPPLSDDAMIGRFDDDSRWLFALRGRPTVAQSLIADRLRDADYDGMAAYLRDDIFGYCYSDDIQLEVIESLLPIEFFDLNDVYRPVQPL